MTKKQLLELLSQNRTIHLRDGFGTFVLRNEGGWSVRGRDDIIQYIRHNHFDKLEVALDAAIGLPVEFRRKDNER